MKTPWIAIVTMLAAAAAPVARAEELNPEQLAKILSELKTIEEQVTSKRLKTRTSAVEAFRTASASDKAALEFYLACIKEINFDRKEARASEFRDWKDQNEVRLKAPSTLTAMRLQLQYLVLTLRCAEGVKLETLVPELESYINNIANNYQTLGDGAKTLKQSVAQTIFAQAYELDQSLRMEDWSYTPGNIETVYQKTLFPFYRKEHPEMLMTVWDRRIAQETSIFQAEHAGDAPALAKFQSDRLPRLQWQRASDVFQSASQPQGALAMLQLLKAHPDHPDATDWVKGMRDLLKAPAAASTPEVPKTAPPAKPAG